MIAIKAANKGKLHAKLGVAPGAKIPAGKIKKAETSASPALRKEAQFADNARKWDHSGKSPKKTTTPAATDRGKFGIQD